MGEIFDRLNCLTFELEITDLEYSDKVLGYCVENLCHNYNTNWMCPKGVGSKDEIIKIINNYKHCIAFTKQYDRNIQNSDSYISNINTLKKFQELSREIKKSIKNSLVLTAGKCLLCEKCAYPLPCINKDMAIPSIEAYGIDIMNILNKYNVQLAYDSNVVTYIGLVLFN